MKKPDQPLFFSMTNDFLSISLPGTASPQTVDAYKDGLTVFRHYLGDVRHMQLRKFTFNDCTFDLVLEYRNWLLDDLERAPSTANHRLAVLKAYLKYAASKDVSLEQIHLSVCNVPFAKAPVKMLPIFSDEEAVRVFLSSPPNTMTGRRDTVILCVLFDAALRVQELTNLQIRDVNLAGDTPHLLIHGKGRKERIVTISDRTVALLQAYIDEAHGDNPADGNWLFFTKFYGERHQMSIGNVERIVRKYGDKARRENPGVPERVHPHMLRRTRATFLYQAGTSAEMIAILLGHTSIQTTMDHYAAPSLQQKKDSMQKGGSGGIIGNAEDIPEWPEDNDEFARLCGLR